MSVEDTVQIRCSRCKSKFRDKVSRLLSGYSRQCPSCECVIFFEAGSPNKAIDEVMREAARVRQALRDEEAEKIAKAAKIAIRTAASVQQTDDGVASSSRHRLSRRSLSTGRAR